MAQDGKLDKHGRTNDATPSSWKTEYVDYSVQGEGLPSSSSTPAQIPTQPQPTTIVPVPAGSSTEHAVEEVVKDGETAEEKAARKAAKKEKKRKAEDDAPEAGGAKEETEEERKARKKAKKEKRKSEGGK